MKSVEFILIVILTNLPLWTSSIKILKYDIKHDYGQTVSLANNPSLIASFKYSNKRDCYIKCVSNTKCALATVSLSNSTCYLFNSLALTQNTVVSNDVETYKLSSSRLNTNGLINYWPIHNDILDYAGNVNLEPMMNITYAMDRFNNPNEALSFPGNGYYNMPTGVYVAGDFTVLAWVIVYGIRGDAKIFDFGNPGPTDDLEFSLSHGTSGVPYIAYNANRGYCQTDSSEAVSLGVWHHLAGVLSGQNLSFYVDGVLMNSQICDTLYIPLNINRTQCMVGRSNYDGEEDAFADYDELKIYSRALSYDEILYDMNFY